MPPEDHAEPSGGSVSASFSGPEIQGSFQFRERDVFDLASFHFVKALGDFLIAHIVSTLRQAAKQGGCDPPAVDGRESCGFPFDLFRCHSAETSVEAEVRQVAGINRPCGAGLFSWEALG